MIEQKTSEASDRTEWADWPADGLELVGVCPVCASQQRRVLYTGLRDRVFFCAPGEWTLHECLSCGSAYLDPRPTPETIHLAYQTYYTHQSTPRLSFEALGVRRCLHRVLANGYRNWRFGSAFEPASALGVLVAFLLPSKRAMLDRDFRHLSRAPQGGWLLDVGFGGGSFLDNARAAGWNVVGVDPDPVAVESAYQRGLDVYCGGLETLDGESSRYDVITMSHVIEHVHDPRATLDKANRLLRPGGTLWLETPNIEGLGHNHFGRHWLHLDPPRHLVILGWQTIMAMLSETGFQGIQPRPRYDVFASAAAESELVRLGLNPYANRRVVFRHRMGGMIAGLISRIRPRKSEFITLTAYKAAQGFEK